MARIKGNVITYGTTGKINNVVLKKRGKTQYISSLPDTSGVVATDHQAYHSQVASDTNKLRTRSFSAGRISLIFN